VNFREAMANFRGHRTPNVRIIERKRWWFSLSGFFILLSIVGLAFSGLNFSIDFNGGSLLKYPCPRCASGEVTPDDVLATLAKAGFTDAEVQIVNGDTLSARTKSLTELGGQPATILRLDNTKGATTEDIRGVLAQFGRADASVSVTARSIRISSTPLSSPVSAITLTFPNSKNLQTTDISTTLTSLGFIAVPVDVFGETVVVTLDKLPLHPKPPTPSPTPPSPSPSASANLSSPSPSASASGSAPARPKGQAAAKKKASSTPAPTASPTVSASASPIPSPSPTPTQAGREEVLAALAKQEGITADQITLRNLSEVTEDEIVAAVADAAGVDATAVKVKEITGREQQQLLQQLADQAGTVTAQINRQDVGPTWGAQISSKAIKGLIIFLVLVTLYIAFRFEWKMAAAAQGALLHDLIITAGIYALVGRTVTPATVIAILTILGYSLYDTVVIFDKIKENSESLAMVTRETYSGVVDISLNQVLMRSVNTSLVVLLPILSLLLFGGSTLKDFAFALFIGVASGTYSSIFLASPLLAVLKEREPKLAAIRLRAESRRPKLQAVATPAGEGGDGDGERELEPAASSSAPVRGPQPRPAAAGSKTKKKRKTTAAQRRRR
jgi:preprotein translocase subunit SecF